MLQKLQQIARESQIHFGHLYIGHIKRDEDLKILAHSEAMPWEETEPSVRAIIEQRLYQAIEGKVGQDCFPCHYTGDNLSVAKVKNPEYDRFQNRPTVEILEEIQEIESPSTQQLIDLGNLFAYKVMSAGSITNHLVGLIKFQVLPTNDDTEDLFPIDFVFGVVCDLDDREESYFDENKGRINMHQLPNVVNGQSVKNAVLFPCVDDQGKEIADMLVWASGKGGIWFDALEAGRCYAPQREAKILIRLIAEQTVGAEVPNDLFAQMGAELRDQSDGAVTPTKVVSSLENILGYGIDLAGFLARWETTFGDLAYMPRYESLFVPEQQEKPHVVKMKAGAVEIRLPAVNLADVQRIKANGQHYLLIAVDEPPRVEIGKDLDLRLRPVDAEGAVMPLIERTANKENI